MLSQKDQNADQGEDHKEALTKKVRAVVDKAMHLLAMEINLEKCLLELTVANSVVERKTWATMQSEVQTKELRKIGNLPPFPQTQGGESKEDADKESGEPTGNCAGFSEEDRSTIEGGMPKRTIGEQLQEMQDKADFISKLQLELRKDIQAFKLSCLQDRSTDSNVVNHWHGNEVLKIQRELQQDIQAGKPRIQDGDANSDMSNTWTGNGALHTIAVPNRVVQEHNRGTKQQVNDALLWKRVPPGPNKPHTKVTKRGKWVHWFPRHHQWTLHNLDECRIRSDRDRDQRIAPKGAQKENF